MKPFKFLQTNETKYKWFTFHTHNLTFRVLSDLSSDETYLYVNEIVRPFVFEERTPENLERIRQDLRTVFRFVEIDN